MLDQSLVTITSGKIVNQADTDSQVLALWLHGRSKHTQRAYSAKAERFLAFTTKPLARVSLGDVQAFADSLIGLAQSSKAQTLAAIKSLLAFAHKIGYIPFNVGATISDGTNTWSAHYTYTNFNAILTRQDARGVVTTYGYDGLNRVSGVSYNTSGTTAQPTASVSITYGSAAPKLGQVEEIKQTDSQSSVPWKENYSYDSLSRVSSKTVSFDNLAYAYTTGYAYNQASQLTQMTYPSTKVIKYGYDNRGRLNTLGDGSLATKYISSMSW